MNVLCVQPWHWYRIMALHQMALQWKPEEKAAQEWDLKKLGLDLKEPVA